MRHGNFILKSLSHPLPLLLLQMLLLVLKMTHKDCVVGYLIAGSRPSSSYSLSYISTPILTNKGQYFLRIFFVFHCICVKTLHFFQHKKRVEKIILPTHCTMKDLPVLPFGMIWDSFWEIIIRGGGKSQVTKNMQKNQVIKHV